VPETHHDFDDATGLRGIPDARQSNLSGHHLRQQTLLSEMVKTKVLYNLSQREESFLKKIFLALGPIVSLVKLSAEQSVFNFLA